MTNSAGTDSLSDTLMEMGKSSLEKTSLIQFLLNVVSLQSNITVEDEDNFVFKIF